MRLSLSSTAAPDATLEELLSACARRGLSGLELVEGGAHGLSSGISVPRAEAVRAAARHTGVEICALYRDRLPPDGLESAVRFAAALGAPVVVPARAVGGDELPAVAAAFAATGGTLLLAHGSEPATVELLRRALAALPVPRAVGLAWNFRPDRDDPAQVGGVLTAAGPDLRCVRLHGGGPETARQTGQGLGALIARLALERYAGPLVLLPSSPRYHYVWRAWLGRAGGWGCGSKQSDPALVTLEREILNTKGQT